MAAWGRFRCKGASFLQRAVCMCVSAGVCRMKELLANQIMYGHSFLLLWNGLGIMIYECMGWFPITVQLSPFSPCVPFSSLPSFLSTFPPSPSLNSYTWSWICWFLSKRAPTPISDLRHNPQFMQCNAFTEVHYTCYIFFCNSPIINFLYTHISCPWMTYKFILLGAPKCFSEHNRDAAQFQYFFSLPVAAS